MADLEKFDLIIVGSGPGGYVAAVRAAQLGLKTACIEKEPKLGGVCLNVGCIPSKALLDSSEYYHLAQTRLAEHGVRTGEVSFDLSTMMKRKLQVVSEIVESVRKLLEGHKIRLIHGTARLAGPDRVEVSPAGSPSSGERIKLEAKALLLATGSEPISVPAFPFDGDRIVSSTEALAFETVPQRLGIIGGGAVGLELGSVWRRLGSQVTVIEMMPRLVAMMDGQVSRTMERVLTRQGFEFSLQTRVLKAEKKNDEVQVTVESKGQENELSFDRLLVAVGRRPLTRDLGLEDVGVKTEPRTGQVRVDSRYRTTVPSIYAIGDLIVGPMLAHKASAEGIAAVECIAGLPGEVNYDAVPSIIYTSPEAAGVGLTEEQLKERGVPYRSGNYPFSGVARARCLGEMDGFAKILVHAETDRILGVHVVGARASDLIAEAVLAVEYNATSEALRRTVHGHPTFSEALHEAAMALRSL